MSIFDSKKSRRIILAAAAAALITVLCVFAAGCRGTDDAAADGADVSGAAGTFMAGTTINGISVEGLTADEARSALASRLEGYALQVTIDHSFAYNATAGQLQMDVNPDLDLQAMIDAQTEDSDPALTVDDLFTFNLGDFYNKISEYASGLHGEGMAVNAHLVFDEDQDEFVVEPGTSGYQIVPERMRDEVEEKVSQLVRKVQYTLSDFYTIDPELGEDSEEVLEALDHANSYKGLQISLSFTPDGRDTSYESIGWSQIRNWLEVDPDGLSILVNDSALSDYVSRLASSHSVSYNTAQFRTTGGGSITVPAATSGQSVNTNGLYSIIYDAVENMRGGSYAAPYDTATETAAVVDFDGNYVEVNQTTQMMYLYRNGSCVLSSPCVTGCVALNRRTPNGVFHIYNMVPGKYLVGPGYRTWVNYWMPFSGGCGLHDAYWRGTFGGTEYLYNGSHGCVNLPSSVAAQLYNSVYVGYPVIVYGGARSADMLPADLTVETTSFSLNYEDTAQIDASGSNPIHFSSSDTSVCTVSDDGLITAVSEGSATITVNMEASEIRMDGTVTVSVTVNHTWSSWSWNGSTGHTRTCSSGAHTENGDCDHVDGGTCSVCGHTYAASTPATEPTQAAAAAPSDLNVGTTSYNLNCGRTAQIAASGSNAIHYSSGNTAVCTVNDSGVITAVNAGTATITVTMDSSATRQGSTVSVSVTVSHEWNGWTDNGDTGHTRTCTGNPAHTETEPHTWSSWTRVEGSTEHRQTCSVCGASVSGSCDHTDGGTCSVCGHEYPSSTEPPESESETGSEGE